MVGTLSFCALAVPGAPCAVLRRRGAVGRVRGGPVLCVVAGFASVAAATVWRDGAGLCVEGGETWREFPLFAGSFKFLPGMGSSLPSGFAPACSLAAVRRATRCTPLSGVETASEAYPGMGPTKVWAGFSLGLQMFFGNFRRRGPWLR